MTVFEFDADKSAVNKGKHGIDFVEAQAIWDDENMVVTEARSDTERRFRALGMVNGKLWAAFHTLRGPKIRIFSVRRARQEDKNDYDNSDLES